MTSLPPPQIGQWFATKGWAMQPFQRECMAAYLAGQSGLLNAPTGSGKTYALWLPCLAEWLENQQSKRSGLPLQVLWITPLRALSKDLQMAMQTACDELAIPWQVGLRTGDTSSTERQKQRKKPPQCLVTTPESLHVLFSSKEYADLFGDLKAVIVDEWHELIGTKRGVQMELAISKLVAIRPSLKVWGISATIGNLPKAAEVLIHPLIVKGLIVSPTIVKAQIAKQIDVVSILPDTMDRFPWAGHLGLNLIHKILPIIAASQTTLLFTNTRAMTEIWYQKLLEEAPDLAGRMAMHHGSLDNEIRNWVENALHNGTLKLVVCTSSLDLGVDFRPVDTVIQVGSPKGAGRFVQRAGRSGHQPGASSKIYFLPTHALELIEGAALRHAIAHDQIESRQPIQGCLDVLVQYVVTLAVSDGFVADKLYQEVITTHAYRELSLPDWRWILDFVVTGGNSLASYDEYKKVEIGEENGAEVYRVNKRKIAQQHRLSIGTIVSDPMVKIKYVNGSYIGTVEESFISRLNVGDVFWFAGRNLEFVRMHEMEAQVRKTTRKAGQLPRWGGGRMLFSSELSTLLREKLRDWTSSSDIEMQTIQPILDLQDRWSAVPSTDELLLEMLESKEGHHLFVYTFAGRGAHEVLAALVAYRLGKIQASTFSLAMNDYGFELLSEQPIPLLDALELDLFSTENLLADVAASLNETEMARRKFRDIASIAGLVFQGYPGKGITHKNLYASTRLLFDVFLEYDAQNLLVKQSFNEVLNLQLELQQIEAVLHQIKAQKIIIKYPPRPTPFAFPILVDRMREQLSSESIEDRIGRMTLQLEQYAQAE